MTDFAWKAVHERLEALARAVEAGSVRSPEEVARILDERARVLASAAEPVATGDSFEALVFSRGGRTYGVDAANVVEALPMASPTPLPGVRGALAGVVNHRTGVVAVVDVAGLRGASEGASSGKIVVVEESGTTVGLLADEIVGVSRVPVASLAGAGSERWLRGTTPDLVDVLDIAVLLQDSQVCVNE